MNAARLNLEDRPSWQKFRHILTSFASDYIDLVAPEQTEIVLEQHVLSLTFVAIASTPDRDRLTLFAQRLESLLQRMGLVGVRRIVLELYATDGEVPILSQTLEIAFIPPSQLATAEAASGLSPRGGALLRTVRGWLADANLGSALQTTGKLAVRDPKGLVLAARNAIAVQTSRALEWIETFPWEDWFGQQLEKQKQRHRRNLLRALLEDAAVAVCLVFLLYFAGGYLSGPTMDLALLPAQHYDADFNNPPYRCGNPGLTKKNYVCLRSGMSYRQVASILGGEGKPLGIDRKFGDRAVVLGWSAGESAINTTFVGDRLVAKAERNL